MTLRVVVVDDERLGRERLCQLLRKEKDLEVVAECEDGRQAVAAIRAHGPDLVLLDVRMPGMSGFDVLRDVGEEGTPQVVFVTAHEEYALGAFDVNAVDYLLKPVSQERLQRMLARVRSVAAARSPASGLRLGRLLGDMRSAGSHLERLLVRTAGRYVFVRIEDLDWIEGAGNYVRLHAGRDSHLLRQTMNGLEERLDPRRFVRIHRSTIVNIERVRDLRPTFSGDYRLTLLDGTELTLSRSYRGKLGEFVSGQRLPGASH